jgi:hypothetical protein
MKIVLLLTVEEQQQLLIGKILGKEREGGGG